MNMKVSRHTYEWVMLHIWMSHIRDNQFSYSTPRIFESEDPIHKRSILVHTLFIMRENVLPKNVLPKNTENVLPKNMFSQERRMFSQRTSILVHTLFIMREIVHPKNVLPKRSSLFICVACRIHMCDMIYSSAWHDLFGCVTWLIHMCDMTYAYVWHDPFKCVTWLIHVWRALCIPLTEELRLKILVSGENNQILLFSPSPFGICAGVG